MFYIRKALYLIVLIGYSFSHAGAYEDFFSAIRRDDPRAMQALLARGMDPNTVNPSGQYGLIVALQADAVKVAEVLIAHASTNVEVRTAKDESPLMLAAIKGYLELCKQLIARDADVNKPGWAPLHYAASGSDPEVVRLLLENFAYIDAASPNGSTPLMMAARYGSTESVRILLEAGADPLLKNALGLSAIEFAQRSERDDAVALIAAAIRATKPADGW